MESTDESESQFSTINAHDAEFLSTTEDDKYSWNESVAGLSGMNVGLALGTKRRLRQ